MQNDSQSVWIDTRNRRPLAQRHPLFLTRLLRGLVIFVAAVANTAVLSAAQAPPASTPKNSPIADAATPASEELADSADAARVDEFIQTAMQSQQIPGVAVAVMRNGRIVLAKGYGFANVEHRVPVTPETVFQSGSVGKAFTVMAVMMLVDAGRLRLDDKLTTHFPDGPPEWNKVTLSHLLEHTSGMTGYPEDFDFRADRTEGELYELIRSRPLAFEPGERRGYSNLGFVLLGILINKVTGQFYGDFLEEKIFGPLEMTTARVISEADIIPNRAAGYRLADGELKNQEWVAPSLNTTADGALYLSVLDVARWEAALNRGALLTKRSYDAMWSNLKTNDGRQQPWGFSWKVETVNGARLVEHSGGWQGFTANFTRYPAERLAVIVFTNLRGANPERLGRGVLEVYRPEVGIAGLKSIRDTEPAVTEFVRDFLLKVTARKLSADMFIPPLAEEIMRDTDAAAETFASYGALEKVEPVGREDGADGIVIHHYRVSYEKQLMVFIFGLAADGTIHQLDIRRY